MSVVDITSIPAPTAVEVPGTITVAGQVLPAGAATQLLEHDGSAWIAGRKITTASTQPTGGAVGDLWFVVPDDAASVLVTGLAYGQARQEVGGEAYPTYGLRGHHIPRSRLAYTDRAFPADGASVNFLRSGSQLLTHLLPQTDRNPPTFANNIDGNGRCALRFTAASTQAMAWPGVVPLQSTDAEWTIAAMFRMPATPTGRQTIVSINRDGAPNQWRECIRLDLTATQMGVVYGTNSSATDDSINAYATVTPAAGQTYIMVGRHGTSGSGLHQAKIDVRAGGSTTTVTNGVSLTHNVGSTAALTQAVVGGYRRGGGWSQHFDGWLLELLWYPFRLSDAETATLITYLRVGGMVS